MKIKERHFPYPVLADFSDDFQQSSYETDIVHAVDSSEFILTVKHYLTNKEIIDLIQNGDAVYSTHIECSKTQTRLMDTSSINSQKITIDSSEVENKIEVCTFIVATRKIEKYSNSSFDEDYQGYIFTVNKGDILAIGYDYNINIEKEQINNSESIIQFERAEPDIKEPFKINFDTSRLVVTLNKKNYDLYKELIEQEELLPVLYSIIGVPVISSALHVIGSEIMSDDNSLNEGYSSKRWYKVLIEKIQEVGADPYDYRNYEESSEVILLAQKILEDPLSISFNRLASLYDDGYDESSEGEFA